MSMQREQAKFAQISFNMVIVIMKLLLILYLALRIVADGSIREYTNEGYKP
jgi:uncharacterized membrane protein (DUF106 family)